MGGVQGARLALVAILARDTIGLLHVLPPFTVNLERIPLRLVGMQQSSAKAVHGEVGVLSLFDSAGP